MEFEITADGKLRYSSNSNYGNSNSNSNSNYKNDFMIRKEVNLGPVVIAEMKRLYSLSKKKKEKI
jgi:hypothetical protein